MKLRLENGNFNINGVLQDESFDHPDFSAETLPKGLSYIDFIGAVIEYGIGATIISGTYIYDKYVAFAIADTGRMFFYDPATGKITDSVPAPDEPVNPGDDGDEGK